MISVVIPSYNSRKTIVRCLDSLFQSNLNKFEVLIVDDCSTDNSVNTIKKYKKNNSKNIQIIQLKKNRGVSYARNIGAKNASSDYVIFLDTDIYVQKNTLGQLLKEIKAHPNSVIGGINSGKNCQDTNASKLLATKIHFDYRWKEGESRRHFSGFQSECGIIEKKLFLELGGFNTRYKKPGIEEYEIIERLQEAGIKNYVYRDIKYDHDMNSIRKRIKSLVKRTSDYVPLLLRKKRFESDGATGTEKEALLSILTILSLKLISLAVLTKYPNEIFLSGVILLQVIILYNIRFLIHIGSKHSITVTLYSIFGLIGLYLGIAIGGIYGTLKLIPKAVLR